VELSKTELSILSEIAKGNENVSEIAKTLSKSKSQIYKIIKKMQKKEIIESLDHSNIIVKKQVHISLLLGLLRENKSLMDFLADSGIKILTTLEQPQTINKIIVETGLKRGIIYRKLKKAISINLIRKRGTEFEINDDIWSTIREFIVSLLKYEQTLDTRIPTESIIYFKKNNEVIYSSLSEQKATKTAFSVFGDYGIRIFNKENFYYLPEKKLTIKEVFKQSLLITEKNREIRYLLYCVLFYLKFKKQLGGVKSSILENINLILEGKVIKGYPSLSEIKEKAGQYDIQL
jgi:predicted transcriptional regulator